MSNNPRNHDPLLIILIGFLAVSFVRAAGRSSAPTDMKVRAAFEALEQLQCKIDRYRLRSLQMPHQYALLLFSNAANNAVMLKDFLTVRLHVLQDHHASPFGPAVEDIALIACRIGAELDRVLDYIAGGLIGEASAITVPCLFDEECENLLMLLWLGSDRKPAPATPAPATESALATEPARARAPALSLVPPSATGPGADINVRSDRPRPNLRLVSTEGQQ